MVEHMVVVHVVAGSIPVIHPKFYNKKGVRVKKGGRVIFIWDSLGNRQDKRPIF